MAFVFLCLISLSTVPSSSIHVDANGRTSFFLLVEHSSTAYTPMLVSHWQRLVVQEGSSIWLRTLFFKKMRQL